MCFEQFMIFVDHLTLSLILRVLDALEMIPYSHMPFRFISFNILIGI